VGLDAPRVLEHGVPGSVAHSGFLLAPRPLQRYVVYDTSYTT
jgi:hypothetical protein